LGFKYVQYVIDNDEKGGKGGKKDGFFISVKAEISEKSEILGLIFLKFLMFLA
jgi:hypothetical protein